MKKIGLRNKKRIHCLLLEQRLKIGKDIGIYTLVSMGYFDNHLSLVSMKNSILSSLVNNLDKEFFLKRRKG